MPVLGEDDLLNTGNPNSMIAAPLSKSHNLQAQRLDTTTPIENGLIIYQLPESESLKAFRTSGRLNLLILCCDSGPQFMIPKPKQ